MRRVIIGLFLGLLCLLVGLGAGVFFAPQLRSNEQQLVRTLAVKVPMLKSMAATDKNSPYEIFDYPMIKWRAKPLTDTQGAIVQLWTRYEQPDGKDKAAAMSYRLTLFKAPDKHQCEVQLLDEMGFKITQFDAGDFHQIPGAPDIMEARDSHSMTEDAYRKIRDYSIK
ncbi:MAG: hypothetical protein K2X27_09220 [Candidatus Obscuribacterales bacterium]|nr:hypothetical protein [Candidatus Obscuribacterales bacterium]